MSALFELWGNTPRQNPNIEEVLDVEYRPSRPGRSPSDQYNTVDIYRPRARPDRPLPVVFFTHGGGWKDGYKRGSYLGYHSVGKALAAGGLVAVLPSYRKSVKVLYPTLGLSLVGALVAALFYSNIYIAIPAMCLATIGPLFLLAHFENMFPLLREGSCTTKALDVLSENYVRILNSVLASDKIQYPSHVQDVAEALGWTYRHAREYGGDPEMIVLSGHSAGAHLTSMIMLRESLPVKQGVPLIAIKGDFLISGPYCVEAMATIPGRRLSYLHTCFGSKPEVWPLCFPLTCLEQNELAAKRLPPIQLAYAEEDHGLDEDSRRLGALLRSAGKDVEAICISGTNHATIWKDMDVAGTRAHEAVLPMLLAFVQRVAAS